MKDLKANQNFRGMGGESIPEKQAASQADCSGNPQNHLQGFTHLYYGEGKGKTTAAAGLTVRAAGHGKRVLFLQFLKGQDSGEIHILKNIPSVTVKRGDCAKFTFQMTEQEKQAVTDFQNKMLSDAVRDVQDGTYDLLILDEILSAVNTNTVSEPLVQDLLTHKPERLELVMTGHNPKDYMMAQADYVTEMRKIKHPYDRGITARKGIER